MPTEVFLFVCFLFVCFCMYNTATSFNWFASVFVCFRFFFLKVKGAETDE